MLYATTYLLQDESDITLLGVFLRVAFVENFWNILHRVRYAEKCHLVYKKTLAEVCVGFFLL